MSDQAIIKQAIAGYKFNELISSDDLYAKLVGFSITQSSYQKSLERLCAQGVLNRLAKSLYYKPKKSKYGIVPFSEKDIVRSFVSNQCGTVVGYALYNSLMLTTQIAKTTEVYSARLKQQTKVVRNIRLKRYPLEYTEENIRIIQIMEVLQNYSEIQDLNHRQFVCFCERIPEYYSDEAFEDVIKVIRYHKSTIAFLRHILDHLGAENNLGRYLSDLSSYRYPRMEDIYATS